MTAAAAGIFYELVAGWAASSRISNLIVSRSPNIQVAAGAAAQIVLTQIVARERLVEAHGKNALANSFADIAGPAVAGSLIRLAGAPLTVLINAVLLVVSVMILRGVLLQVIRHAGVPARFGFRPDPVQQ